MVIERMPQEIEGAVCPNCGSETIWPLALGGAQCRKFLKHYPNLETVMKEVY